MKITLMAFRILNGASTNVKIHLLVLLIFPVFLVSCIEKYYPELDNKYENVLVVDGLITNEPGPYYIRLSLASTVNDPEFLPLSDHDISIIDDEGTTELLTEILPGTYSTSSAGIQGIVGKKYKIQIVSPSGKTYQSDFETLKNPTGIDSVYAIFESHANPVGVFPYDGYQFYLNTKMAESDTNFYMWRLEQTYEYRADFLIRYIYEGAMLPFSHSDSLETCWKTDKIRYFFTYNTVGMSAPDVKGFPLNYVTTETRELMEKYSLLVSQFTISERAYNFWNAVREQNTSQENLYTRQPYQIRGNVFNSENQDEPVFGAFLVAGISQKRIFVNRPAITFRYPFCHLDDADYKNVGTVYLTKPDEWPLYITTDVNGFRAFPNQDCINCQLTGGTIVKPDFWIDY